MLQQIIYGFKLAKYGLKFKMQVAFSIIFLLCGIVVEFVDRGRNMLGGFYIVLSAMFTLQLIISLDISTMVQTSPYKKKLQTSLPILTSTPVMLLSYTVVVFIRLYYIYLDPVISCDWESRAQVKTGLVAIILLLFMASAYMGVCYKYFVAAFIGLMLCVFPTSYFFYSSSSFAVIEQFPIAAVVIFGYLMILAGQGISYLLITLTYKKELSRYAFGAAMKRQNH